MNKEEKDPPISVDNIYRLNGRVPLQKAIPFGLQHVLAMFVSKKQEVIFNISGNHSAFATGIGTCKL